jgi:endonuclease/exonuclease/phosphatase family metal-dependent hydrolase
MIFMCSLNKKIIKQFPLQAIFLVTMLFITIVTTTVVQAGTHPSSINVVSFNVLAPCWASPSRYPQSLVPYLDRALRRALIIKFLTRASKKADIITLQETTRVEFSYFKEALQDTYYAFEVYHDPAYWSEWITTDVPWEPSGVAIFVKKTSFTNVNFRDIALSKDGNHSAYFEGIQQSTGLLIRAASIHLDSGLDSNRYQELNALLRRMPPKSGSRDIIAGDFNQDTQTSRINQSLEENNFVDTLQYLNREEWTHPFDVEDDKNAGILDHIIVRNTTPIEGHVFNSNLWKLYPHDESGRIIANFQIIGSDHFPLYSVVN